MKNTILLFSVFMFILSCNFSSKQPKTEFSIDAVKAHIVEMNKSYGDRFIKNDSSFYIKRYCKDAEVYSPGLPAVIGRDSIIHFFFQDGNNKEAKIELPIGIIYGSADLVVEEGTYNFPDGKGGSFDKGKFIALWKQEDGVWKLFREIWNTDIQPKQ